MSLERLAEAEVTAQALTGELRVQTEIRLAVANADWVRAESLGVALERDETATTIRRVRAALAAAAARAARGELQAAARMLDGTLDLAISSGSVSNVDHVLRTQLALAAATGRSVGSGVPPAVADTVIVAQWAASTGDTATARELLAALSEPAGPVTTSALRQRQVEATIAGVEGQWGRVIELLGSFAWEGVPTGGADQALRWAVAEAHERMGRADSAAAYFDLVTTYTRMGLMVQFRRGTTYSFAHRRAALLYTQLQDLDTAEEHWLAFLDAFTNPDPEFEWMVDEARGELERIARGR